MDGVLLHVVAQPGREVAPLVVPGHEFGHVHLAHGVDFPGRFGGRHEVEILVGQQGGGQGFHKVENARLPGIAQAEGMVIVEDVDDFGRSGKAVAPGGVLFRRERPLVPALIIEAQADVRGQGRVAQQKTHPGRGNRSVDIIGAAPAQHMVRALGQHGLETQLFQSHGQVVVIDELRIAEGRGLFAEKPLDPLALFPDLDVEFIPGVEKGQGVGRCFGHKFHVAGIGQGLEALHHLGRVLLELVQGRARDGKSHLEGLAVTADQLEQQVVHGQIAGAGREQQGVAVVVVVLVK